MSPPPSSWWTPAAGGWMSQAHRWYTKAHAYMTPLNESKFFAGLVVVLLNLSVKHVDVGLSKTMQSYFKNSFSRQALVFAMIWMPTRDVLAALVVSTLVIFCIDCLANDEHPLCVLPSSFREHHLSLLQENMEDGGANKKENTPTGSAGGAGDSGKKKEDAAAAPPQDKDLVTAIRALEYARTLLRQAETASGTALARVQPAAAGGGEPPVGARWSAPMVGTV